MVKPDLNATDYGVLHAIGDFWALHGYAPGLRDLIGASPTVNSTSTVKYRLHALTVFGVVRRTGAPERNICLAPAAFAYLHSTDVVRRFTLPYPISIDRLWKSRRNSGELVLSDEGKAFNALAVLAAREQRDGRPLLTGDLALSAHFYRLSQRDWISDLAKLLPITLRGIAFRDAHQIVEQRLYSEYDAAIPRAEIEIWKVR